MSVEGGTTLEGSMIAESRRGITGLPSTAA